MVTFSQQNIDATSFAGLRGRLTDGVGFFAHAPFKYCVFDSDQYRFDVFRRTGQIAFTHSIAVTGVDSADNDDLGIVNASFNASSTPRFGVGTHTLGSSKSSYEITFRIEVVP